MTRPIADLDVPLAELEWQIARRDMAASLRAIDDATNPEIHPDNEEA
ncbi:hypothetical protein [Streptomyces sp. NPDC101249]